MQKIHSRKTHLVKFALCEVNDAVAAGGSAGAWWGPAAVLASDSVLLRQRATRLLHLDHARRRERGARAPAWKTVSKSAHSLWGGKTGGLA